MAEGVILGGWEFVIAAYSITGVALAAYALRLAAKLRKQNK